MNAVTATPSPLEPDEIPVDEVRTALERVLQNSDFARNTNCSRILRFIVEETLEGRGARLKAFSIATLALNRPGDFNPQANSIVRVQAKRLRELLGQYYADAGVSDSIVIHLPVGNYQPQFIRRAPRPHLAPRRAPKPDPIAPEPAARQRGLFKALICAAMALMGLAALAVREIQSARPGNSEPVIAIASPDVDDTGARDAGPKLFMERLRAELAAFDHVRLAPSAPSRGAPGPLGYRVVTRFVRTDGAGWDIALSLVRAPSGDVVWAHQFENVDGRTPGSFQGALDHAARAIADPGVGAIFNDMRARQGTPAAPVNGYACYLEGQAYLRDRAPGQASRAQTCLEATLRANPRDIGALTTLATLLTDLYLVSGKPELLARATRLATEARRLEPRRAETEAAMFMVAFYAGRIDEAFGHAAAALSLNPNATLIAAEIAEADMARGRYEDALKLLRESEGASRVAFAAGAASLAIASHMLGLQSAAYRYATRAGNSETPMGLLARIVVCHDHPGSSCAPAAIAQLRSQFPQFAADVPGALQRREMIEETRSRLLRDLEGAGYFATSVE